MGGQTISTSETRIEAFSIQSSAYGVTMPVVYGVARMAGNLVWYGDFKATAHTTSQGGKGGGSVENTSYSYSASVVMGLCEGTVANIPRVWVGKKLYADDVANGTALSQLGISRAQGALGQATWSYLSTSFSAQAIGYSGLANVYAQDYPLSGSAQIDNHSFEIYGLGAWASGYGSPDAKPNFIQLDLLTNTRYGANFPAGKLDAWTSWEAYCLANGLLLSPALTEQLQAAEFINTMGKLTNTAPVWSAGTLKMLPYGDASATGNGATYTPNVTPPYDLSDDDFCPASEGSDPIKVTRKPQVDAYNHVRVEFLNRGSWDATNSVYLGGYNIEIAEAKDSANIDAFGLRSADVLKAHWICDAAVARNVAQLLLQRTLYIRNTYEFTLHWFKALLEPMDLVTLTDSALQYNKLPVRITEVSESESGDLTIIAEEFPLGVASATLYPSQVSDGYQNRYNTAPGSVITPMFFEAPIERTTTGLEVYAAVTGLGAYWGGCRVWVSLDGTNYKDAGSLHGGARYGTLSGAISAGNLPVTLNAGQLISGSAADASNLSTLCYIGGANPEYLAYTTAALTGALAYTLSGLNRSAFTTSGAAHSASDPFARVDTSLAKSGPLDLSMVGKTIYFKFTSFNFYNAAEESLASVTAYPYTITGSMANLAPAAFDQFTVMAQPDGTRQFNFCYTTTAVPVDWQGAEIRYISGTTSTPTWSAMTALQDSATFYTNSPIELNAPLSGTYTFACKSLDKLGNESAYKVVNITLPDRRLGNVFDEYFEHSLGWPGTKTGCQIVGTTLEATDTTTWATLPATWAAWTRWNASPASPIYYETPARDFGIIIAGQINATIDADGTTVLEYATSTDGTTWGAWGSAAAPFATRYIKLRLTVTATIPAPVPTVRTMAYQINSPMHSEYLNDVVLSALTGAYRIAVGDIRIPLGNTYTVIKRTTVVVQDSSVGTWTYARIDQSLSPAPRWQFRLNGTLADPAKVDFFIEGY